MSLGEYDVRIDSPFREDEFEAAFEAEGSSQPTLRRGARGGAVAHLQAALTAAGFPTVTDGDFGAATERSVRAFQSARGMDADGIVGPNTWSALGAIPGTSPPTGAVAGAEDRSDGTPDVALATLVLDMPGRRSFRYQFTMNDLIWTAKLMVHEAGGNDDPDNAAVLWAMFNRYALFTHSKYPSFEAFIRRYSTTLQPVLHKCRAAERHYLKGDAVYIKTGGMYPGTEVPKGQLVRHLRIQRAPWHAVKASARQLATRALTGQLPNPGIGLASEFASTMVYFRQRHRRRASTQEWLDYTIRFARSKSWTFIGDIGGIDPKKNAFFVQNRVLTLPDDAVQIRAPGAENEAGEDTSAGELLEEFEDSESPVDDWEEAPETYVDESQIAADLDDEWETADLEAEFDEEDFFADDELELTAYGVQEMHRSNESLALAANMGDDEELNHDLAEQMGAELAASDSRRSEASPPPEEEIGAGVAFLAQEEELSLRNVWEAGALALAIARGERDVNKLTNMLFLNRHPERSGRPLSRNEPDFAPLADEWRTIRDTMVSPQIRLVTRLGRPTVPGSESTPPGVSPIARRADQMWTGRRRPKRWQGQVYGLVVHQTGGKLPCDEIAAGNDVMEGAVAHYFRSHGTHYVCGWGGRAADELIQVADEHFQAHGVGMEKQKRSIAGSGGWMSDISTKTAAHWRQRWPKASSPTSLLPGTRYANPPYIHVEMIPVVVPWCKHYAGANPPLPMRPGLRYSKAQHDSVADLAVDIANRNGWPEDWWETSRLVGHEDLSPISRSIKSGGWDPGALRDDPWFDWHYVKTRVESMV